MSIAIMQPYIFPYIGYFQLINSVDKFIIYSHVNYKKKSWINRNMILIKGQSIEYFGIPIKGSKSKIINEIAIDTNQNWENHLLRMIYYNYKSSTYYRENIKIIETLLLSKRHDKLHELNSKSIIGISKILGIETEMISDREYFKNLEKIVRQNSNKQERKENRIFSICNHEKEKEYINSIGGKELYKKCTFKENGIELKFLRSNSKLEENSNLSILHILMEIGIENSKKLLKEYTYE